MTSVIIGAAGSSERFGSDKMKASLGGMPVLMRTVFAFQSHPKVDEIILVVQERNFDEYQTLRKAFSKISQIIPGGKTRQESIILGVLESQGSICLVHNGANPLVTHKEITETIQAAKEEGSAFVGRKVSSTLHRCSEGKTSEICERENLYEAETPQGFQKKLYLEALENAKVKKGDFTDEVSMLQSTGIQSKLIEASPQNRKITTPYDLQVAENFLTPHTRTGIGHDSHRFIPPSPAYSVIPAKAGIQSQDTLQQAQSDMHITLGGIQIPHTQVFEANSDGDVIIHALCNAIGTAIGEGSLSRYADKMAEEGIKDSMKYLEHIYENMLATGYSIGNIALSIEGKEPKLEKHIKDMKEALAKTLNINAFQIGIACTTGEELTSFGKGAGIQCFCSVQLIKL